MVQAKSLYSQLQDKLGQLIPAKTDKRPPLLLVLGNPATHSVESGMFFSFEGNKKNIDSGAEFISLQVY